MKSVLQITTPDEIGLLEKASEFIFRHNGSIDSDTVRVYGDKAFLLLHFQAAESDVAHMHTALANYPPFSGLAHVELVETNEPNNPQPRPIELAVICRDIRGLLANVTKLIQAHEYLILSHDGTPKISFDDVTYEYKQTFTLSISRERLEQETILVDGRRVLRWLQFKHELNALLEPLRGRATTSGN